VLLPLPLPGTFTYQIPLLLKEQVSQGVRVLVPFGKRKLITGVVKGTHDTTPTHYEPKEIIDVLDHAPSITINQLRFFEWVAHYYMCSEGEVLQAALPSGLKLNSESFLELHPEFDAFESLSSQELLLMTVLKDKTISFEEAAKVLKRSSAHPVVKSLLEKKAITLYEQVKEKYKVKTEKRIRLVNAVVAESQLQSWFEKLEKTPKQLEVLLAYLRLVPVLTKPQLNATGLDKKTLLGENISESSLKTLIKQGLMEEYHFITERLHFNFSSSEAPDLSPAQEACLEKITLLQEEKNTVLLQGVTGSGKTEIYINLIKKELDKGKQALLLVPEIALTTQLMNRLAKFFGQEMGIYHSKFSDNERVEIWNNILNGKTKFIVGVRSSIFLPFSDLGLVIVDEEHESSYKQQDPAPRYNARDSALYLASTYNAFTVLGSATPSMDSYYNAQTGKYGWVELTERYGDATLPQVQVIDMKRENKFKTAQLGFSSVLVKEIQATLKAGKQIIIFQNRRGYAPVLECQDCAHVSQCPHCSVSLTVHSYKNELRCHYCGHSESIPPGCKVCGSTHLSTQGTGTEKIEEDLKQLFPETSVIRMDQDTTKSKNGFQRIINSFQNKEAGIMVGTQMVTKGLDFEDVELVGIYHADRMWNFPDFRSVERSFQTLVQVSGRAGRKSQQGKVMIQTYDVKHPLFKWTSQNDYNGFALEELNDRQLLHYPPFTRLIKLAVKSQDKSLTIKASQSLAKELRKHLKGATILGPEAPAVDKIRNYYIQDILIKLERNSSTVVQNKQLIAQHAKNLNSSKEFRNIYIVTDVDPLL
ncbi:MAG TPA: primosomal protein N', partial [Cytophagaceae bacterium]|nr:primosomal protein N' [Cytophagaceae bacterium]